MKRPVKVPVHTFHGRKLVTRIVTIDTAKPPASPTRWQQFLDWLFARLP